MAMDLRLIIWLLVAVCMLFSFILSGMEAGVFALSRLRIRQQMRAGRRSAAVLYGFLENPENFLWTILVGNTLANFVVVAWMVAMLHRHFRDHLIWFVIVFSFAVFLFYAFSDLLPKMLFRTYPNRLCLAIARPFRLLYLGLRPVVALVEWSSRTLLRWRGGKAFTGHLFGNREELRLVMRESAQGLTSEERVMIERVLDLQSLTVRQAMKPLPQAITVTTETTAGEALTLGRQHGVTRLPVWEQRDGQKRIAGVVSLNALLFGEDVDHQQAMAALMNPALYVEEDMRLEVALRRMQRSGQRLAIVLGRDRRETGLLSLEDILKVIFGEVSL
jgi:CBS domain containing-hemolysin-like protein